jgi:hypothetical protein
MYSRNRSAADCPDPPDAISLVINETSQKAVKSGVSGKDYIPQRNVLIAAPRFLSAL